MIVKLMLGGELPPGMDEESLATMKVIPETNSVLKLAGVTFHIMAVHHVFRQYLGDERYQDHEVVIYANRA